MPNAIKELLLADIAIDGFVTITLGADLGSAAVQIDYDDSQGDVVSAFESVPAIGPGNIAAEEVLDGDENRIGWLFTLTGALANRAIDPWTVMSSLAKAAGDVTIGGTAGVADTPAVAILTSPYLSRVSQVNQIWSFTFGGATTGSITVAGPSGSTVISADTDQNTASMQANLNTICSGSSNVSVTGSGPFAIEIMGVYGGTDRMFSIANRGDMDGSPEFSVTSGSIAGVPQQDKIVYVLTPDAGRAILDYGGGHMVTINASDSNATILAQFAWVGAATVTGDFNTGHFFTFNDNGFFGTFSGAISTSSLVLAGTKQAPTFATTGSPTSGGFIPQADGVDFVSGAVAFNADSTGFTGILSGTFNGGTVSGSAGGPWTVTAPSAAANQTITVRANTLGVDLAAVMDEVQAGGPAGSSRARALQLLRQ